MVTHCHSVGSKLTTHAIRLIFTGKMNFLLAKTIPYFKFEWASNINCRSNNFKSIFLCWISKKETKKIQWNPIPNEFKAIWYLKKFEREKEKDENFSLSLLETKTKMRCQKNSLVLHFKKSQTSLRRMEWWKVPIKSIAMEAQLDWIGCISPGQNRNLPSSLHLFHHF